MIQEYDSIFKFLQTKDKDVLPESWDSNQKCYYASRFKKDYQLLSNHQGQIVMLHRSVHLEDGYKDAYWKIVPRAEEVRDIIARKENPVNLILQDNKTSTHLS